jgi:hypothetical protein
VRCAGAGVRRKKLGPAVDEVDAADGEDTREEHANSDEQRKKRWVVAVADAAAEPGAMVVEPENAGVADAAVRGTDGAVYVAGLAVLD